jgi:hypothetical protein
MDEWYYLSLLFCVWLADKFFFIHTRGLQIYQLVVCTYDLQHESHFRIFVNNTQRIIGADFESPPDFCIPRPPTVWNWICVIQVIPLAKKITSLIVHSKKVYRNISVTKLRITTVLTSDDEVF